jgi:leucyl aminopeptidase
MAETPEMTRLPMTTPAPLKFVPIALEEIERFEGRVAITVPHTGKLDQAGRRLNRLMRGSLERFVDSEAFSKMAAGDARDLSYPAGLAAEALQVVKLDARPTTAEARKAGAAIGRCSRSCAPTAGWATSPLRRCCAPTATPR